MTAAVYTSRVLRRLRSSHAQQLVFKARQTCSRVTSGFFPPQPLRLTGDKDHGEHAQDQVPLQTLIMTALVVPKTQFALANPNAVLDVPPSKGDAEQLVQRRIRWGVR